MQIITLTTLYELIMNDGILYVIRQYLVESCVL